MHHHRRRVSTGKWSRGGQAVQAAVERFAALGEALADRSADMADACRDARAAGSMLEHLCEAQHEEGGPYADKHPLARAARSLLAAVTRVLLLADAVVVRHLLSPKDRVSISLNRLENVSNFTEFVKAFSQFGTEMVELAHLISREQNDVGSERRRAQMAAARQVLERSTLLLLTASKACLRHPDCDTARENRDTVFLQMRRSMDVVHHVVKEGVLPDLCGAAHRRSRHAHHHHNGTTEAEQCLTVFNALRKFDEQVEMSRLSMVSPAYRSQLGSALDAVLERGQEFTDSAYTSHEHRQRILLRADRLRATLQRLLRHGQTLEQIGRMSPTEEVEAALQETLQASQDLKLELQATALDQAEELSRQTDKGQLLHRLKHAAMTGDRGRLRQLGERFGERAEHLQEVCKLLHHVAYTESIQVLSKNTESCLQTYGPQVLSACHTLFQHPSSKVARENLDVFLDVWRALDRDVASLARDVVDALPPPSAVYATHPTDVNTKLLSPVDPSNHVGSGKGVVTPNQLPVPGQPTKLDAEEQSTMAQLGLEMQQLTSEMAAEADKWPTADNDIVRRAKAMSQMAFSMYHFTRGEGDLKTTQDLFTQAEFFAEEANRFYKVVRHFSYQVPGGPNKKELLENLDRVPTFVQQLQFTVKNPTVGKAATFTKVDNVIKETKNLMNAISKVVHTCLGCATKFNLDFGSASERSRMASPSRGGGGGEGGEEADVARGPQSVSDPGI